MTQIGPVLIAPLEDCSEDKKRKKEAEERAERVATSFVQEKSRLGPLMFIPGRVLHIQEGEREGSETSTRWAWFITLGLVFRSVWDREYPELDVAVLYCQT